jgi:hypothetical protein
MMYLTIKEMHINMILRLHLTTVRMTIIKKTSNNEAGEKEGKKESS